MFAKWKAIPLAALVSLGACTAAPGPGVIVRPLVLPGVGKPFEEFERDDSICRQWAARQAEAKPGDPAPATATGAAGGAVADRDQGVPIGARAGRTARGAARGGYDIAYQQCMFARGNQIRGITPASRPAGIPSPPPPPVDAPPPSTTPARSSATPAPAAGAPPPR